jgi:hypothetical protein
MLVNNIKLYEYRGMYLLGCKKSNNYVNGICIYIEPGSMYYNDASDYLYSFLDSWTSEFKSESVKLDLKITKLMKFSKNKLYFRVSKYSQSQEYLSINLLTKEISKCSEDTFNDIEYYEKTLILNNG